MHKYISRKVGSKLYCYVIALLEYLQNILSKQGGVYEIYCPLKTA